MRYSIARRLPFIAALAGASVMLASVTAHAQPRADPKISHEAFSPVTEPAAMAEWLKRLTGRYAIDGMVHVVAQDPHCGLLPPEPQEISEGQPPPEAKPAPPEPPCRPITGKADCIGVGTGPGEHCILNALWQDIFKFGESEVTDYPGAVSYMDPAMVLFGLDPGRGKVNYLLVDQKGLPEGSLGQIVGNRATFTSHCVNIGIHCERIVRIEAKPNGRLVYLWIDLQDPLSKEIDPTITAIVMSLRRMEPDVKAVRSQE